MIFRSIFQKKNQYFRPCSQPRIPMKNEDFPSWHGSNLAFSKAFWTYKIDTSIDDILGFLQNPHPKASFFHAFLMMSLHQSSYIYT